jgi:hypothetical protein
MSDYFNTRRGHLGSHERLIDHDEPAVRHLTGAGQLNDVGEVLRGNPDMVETVLVGRDDISRIGLEDLIRHIKLT